MDADASPRRELHLPDARKKRPCQRKAEQAGGRESQLRCVGGGERELRGGRSGSEAAGFAATPFPAPPTPASRAWGDGKALKSRDSG